MKTTRSEVTKDIDPMSELWGVYILRTVMRQILPCCNGNFKISDKTLAFNGGVREGYKLAQILIAAA